MEIGQKIRRLRKLRGLTIEDVASKADLTKGSISQLERDLSVPTVTTLKQVLDVLGVSMSSFFSDISERERNLYTVKDRTLVLREKNFTVENLIPKLKYLEMEPQIFTIEPQSEYKSVFQDNEGFGYLLKGKIEVTVNAEKKVLTRGDCFYIFFDNEIVLQNLSAREAEILIVNY